MIYNKYLRLLANILWKGISWLEILDDWYLSRKYRAKQPEMPLESIGEVDPVLEAYFDGKLNTDDLNAKYMVKTNIF